MPGDKHTTMVPKRLEDGLWYVLILNLIYPAVLGSIFYSLLQYLFTPSLYIFSWENTAVVILCLVVVLHFHIDCLYVSLLQRYDFSNFMVDLIIVALTYNAYHSIDPLSSQKNLHMFFVSMLLIYTIFLPQELKIWRLYKKSANIAFAKVHAMMLLHTLTGIVIYGFFAYFADLATYVPSILLILAINVSYGFILRRRYLLEEPS